MDRFDANAPDESTGRPSRQSGNPILDALSLHSQTFFDDSGPSQRRELPVNAAQTLDVEPEPVYRSLCFDSAPTEDAGPRMGNYFDVAPMDDAPMDMSSILPPSLTKPSLTKGALPMPSLVPPSWTEHVGPQNISLNEAESVSTPVVPNEIVVPGLPEYYVLEQNHFFVRGAAVDVATNVQSSLSNMGASVQKWRPLKAKWAALWYCPGSNNRVEFRVRIWGQNGRQICEIQRRDGCCVAFRRVVESIRQTLAEQQMIIGGDGQVQTLAQQPTCPSVSVAEARTLCSQVAPSLVASECTESFGVLRDMMHSDFGDISTEALRSVATMSACEEAAQQLHVASVLGATVTALSNEDPDARRCAAAASANFAEHMSTKSALVDAGVISALVPLVLDPLCEVDTQREAARALANLSDAYAADILGAGGSQLESLLQSCDSIADGRLRGHAMRARTRLVC
mmetsp:Transcript_25475/g.50833  ORF Transcript_25475/g.50833 Transcript_25475/m.50833 type:complete len:455 (-) Transcript_25475:247-1611(-)